MSEREEVFDVTAKANVAKATPETLDISFPPGVVVAVEIVIPDGVAGLAGIALAQAHQPVIPRATGKFFVGNDEVIKRDTEGYNNTGDWQAVLYNEDVNEHTFEVRFSIREVTATVVPSTATPGPVQVGPGGEVAGGTGEATPPPPEGEPIGESPSPPPPTEEGQPSPPPEAEAPVPAPEPEAPPESEPEPPAAPEPEASGQSEPPATPEPEPAAVGPEPEAAADLGEAEASEGPEVLSQHAQPITPRPKSKHAPQTRTEVVSETLPAGGWLAHGKRFTIRRTDQGQDFITDWKGAIIAPGPGYVVHILSDKPYPSGFGPKYAVVHIDSGPFGGKDWYIGHCTSAVGDGQHFHTGAVLAHADQGHVEGGGWCELGEAPNGYPGPMGAGAKIAHLFGTVTRKHTVTVHKAPPHRPVKHTPAARKPPKHGAKTVRKPAARHPAAHAAPKAKAGAARRAPSASRAGGVAHHAAAAPKRTAPAHHEAPRAAPHAAPAPRRAPVPAHHEAPKAPAPRRPPPPPPPPPRRAPPPPPPPPPRRAPPPPPPKRGRR